MAHHLIPMVTSEILFNGGFALGWFSVIVDPANLWFVDVEHIRSIFWDVIFIEKLQVKFYVSKCYISNA